METPSSTRRVTRSQTLAALSNGKNNSTLGKLEDSEKELTETKQKTTMKQQDRSALFDITNDSPIVGLAMGIFETPSSAMSKKKVMGRGKLRQESSSINNTPGSGEALLRGQVKTLLQKVEEEAVLSKLTSEQGGPFLPLKGLVNSPMGLVIAPTPANTPQILSLSAQSKELGSPVEDKFLISQMISEIIEGKKKKHEEEKKECEKNVIVTRSLLLDFSEKSEESFSSVVTCEGNKEKTASAEDDDASIWSIQVNASIRDEQEEEECDGEEDDGEYYYYNYDDDDAEEEGEEEVGESELVDELCEGISKINVAAAGRHTRFCYNSDGEIEREEEVCGDETDSEDDDDAEEEGEEEVGESELVDELCEGISKINVAAAGKHTRFCYNSDGEIEREEEVCGDETDSGALRLKGLPTPRGKHLRFPDEEQMGIAID